MSTITLVTVLQVISDRKTAILKDLERIDTDKRVKNAEVQKPALYARIDECDKILNLLKDQFYVTPAQIAHRPIYTPGNKPGELFGTLVERADQDALGNTQEGANGAGMVADGANAGQPSDWTKHIHSGTVHGDYASPLHALQGPDPLHPV